MANGFHFNIDDHTSEVAQKVAEQVNLALNLMGEVVEGYAREDCPVNTGLLRNSITHVVAGQSPASRTYHADKERNGAVRIGRYPGSIGKDTDHACYVGSNVEYAPAVEFRDINHNVGKAHFLRDAGTHHIDELKDVAQKTLKKID